MPTMRHAATAAPAPFPTLAPAALVDELRSQITRLLRQHTVLNHTAPTIADGVIEQLDGRIYTQPVCRECGSPDIHWIDVDSVESHGEHFLDGGYRCVNCHTVDYEAAEVLVLAGSQGVN